MKDSVGKWYKDRAKDLNVIPPHEAWNNIEQSMEDWPKHWYQSNFEGMQSGKGGESWQAIAEQLEIQRNAKLARRNFYIRTASMVAGLVLLPMWIANVTQFSVTTQTNAPDSELVATVDSPDADAQETTTPANAIVPNPSIPSVQNVASNPGSISVPVINVVTPVTNASLAQNVQEKQELIALETRPSNGLVENLPFADDLALRITESIRLSEPLENAQERTRNWFVGPTAVVGSSELLNPLSYRDDASTSNSMNVAYGVTASRKFKKNKIAADLLFNDRKAQLASINSEELTTSLNYITAALRYERSVPVFKSATKLQPELNFGAGVFGSVLSNSTVSSNQSNSHYSSFTYRNFDFGGVLTAGSSVQLGKAFRMGVNARVQSGAINLFEGREKVPSKLFRTQSLATGIQMNLSYNF